MATEYRLNSMEESGKVMQAMAEQGFPCKVRIGPESRSLSQNSLMWLWLDQMAKWFTANGHEIDKDKMHDLMRHLFLGYEDRSFGKVKIPQQLRSTTDLDKAEMAQYMTMVDQWAADKGCLLPKPEDSEYVKYMQEMGEMV